MRHALVIGNSRYRHLTELKNPINDAGMIAKQLTWLGFDVIGASDASRRDMLAACTAFRERLLLAGDQAVAILYYAGHGVQAFGQNFLLPVDMTPDDAAWLEQAGLSLDWVLHGILQTRARQTRIAIIDACRNNPFAQQGQERTREALPQARGLAQALPPQETLIAFSTSPSQVALDGLGNYGPYAAALAEAMATPGVPVEGVFKQVRKRVHAATYGAQTPWEHSSLIDEFYFVADRSLQSASRGLSLSATLQDVIRQGIGSYDAQTANEIKQKGHLIHKLKAKDLTGQWAYYFILVEQNQEPAFMKALKSEESINLQDYGKIIASNYGEFPSTEVKDFLKRNYGFDI